MSMLKAEWLNYFSDIIDLGMAKILTADVGKKYFIKLAK